MKPRSMFAEFLGTALLVFFGAGTATLSFGFKITGTSLSAGVVATAARLRSRAARIGLRDWPDLRLSREPSRHDGLLSGDRISLTDAIGYWAAQIRGGIAGAAGIYGIVHASSIYHTSIGLGADGYGKSSMIGANAAGAFAAEVVLTFLFVFVILAVTRRASNATVAGLVIGLTLTLVHIVGIPIDGTSVNPARSLGPALFVGGSTLSQLWELIGHHL